MYIQCGLVVVEGDPHQVVMASNMMKQVLKGLKMLSSRFARRHCEFPDGVHKVKCCVHQVDEGADSTCVIKLKFLDEVLCLKQIFASVRNILGCLQHSELSFLFLLSV